MKILVPIDGSTSANHAIDHVIKLAQKVADLDIHLLNVHIPVMSGHAKMFVSEQQLNDYYRVEGYTALKPAEERFQQANVPFTHHISVGHVAETIAKFAKENNFDQIIMGTRGMAAISDLILGSVAHKVIHLSSVPVTLIK